MGVADHTFFFIIGHNVAYKFVNNFRVFSATFSKTSSMPRQFILLIGHKETMLWACELMSTWHQSVAGKLISDCKQIDWIYRAIRIHSKTITLLVQYSYKYRYSIPGILMDNFSFLTQKIPEIRPLEKSRWGMFRLGDVIRQLTCTAPDCPSVPLNFKGP